MSYLQYKPDTNIELFRTNMANIQPPNNYSVSFVSPNNKYIEVYPDLIQMPQTSMQTMIYSPWGFPTQLPVHGECGEMLMSFIILSNWAVPKFFEEWFESIQPRSEKNYLSAATTSYASSIGSCSIKFYKNRKLTRNIHISEIYPLSIPPVEFSAASTGYANWNVVFYVRNLLSNDVDYSETVNVDTNQSQTQ